MKRNRHRESQKPDNIRLITIPLEQLWEHELRNEINKFAKDAEFTHPRQTLAWAECLREKGQYFLTVSLENQRILGYSLVRKRLLFFRKFTKYFVNYGPVASSLEALTIHLSQLVKVLGSDGDWLRINPYITGNAIYDHLQMLKGLGFRTAPSLSIAYSTTVTVNLDQSLEKIKSGFRRSLKTQLNKAERLDIRAEHCGSESVFQDFVRLHNQVASKRGFSDIDVESGKALFRYIKEEPACGCFLVIKGDNEGLLAAILLLCSGKRVLYEYGYTSPDDEYRHLPLGHVLHWQGIQWAKEHGFAVYDFGGYWPDRGDADPINRFKTGFSKQIEDVLPVHVYYLTPISGRLIELAGAVKRVIRRLFQ